MPSLPVNLLAVIVATLAKFFLGWIWFGPVFGKPWMRMVGMTPERAKSMMGRAIVYDLVLTFFMSVVLALAVHYAGATTWYAGALVGFLGWLGFIGTTTLAATLYEQRPFAFWIINNTYFAVALAIMGAILAVWA